MKLITRVLLLMALVLTGATSAYTQTLLDGQLSAVSATCATPGSCVSVDVRGKVSIGVYLNVATSGTFVWEASMEATGTANATGVVWFSITDDVSAAASATADGAYFFSNPGYRRFRIRPSAIVGVATVRVEQGQAGLRSTASVTGSDGALLDGANAAIKGTIFDLTNSNPVATQIVDANGDAITSFGGGTQYTEADVDASITGTAILWEVSSNTLGVINASQPLPVVQTGALNIGTVTTVTAVTTITNPVTITDGAGAVNVIIDSGTTAVTATNLDVQIGGSDTVTVTATNLDVQIGGSDTVAVSNGGLTELAAAINSNILDVNIVSGAGSGGTAIADGATVTPDSTSGTPIIGIYQASVSACVSGDGCVVGITTGRAMKVFMSAADGTAQAVATDMTVGTAFSTTGPGQLALYQDFDGAALATPANVDTELEAVPISASIKGVQYMMLVSEDGSLQYGTTTTPMVIGDGAGALNVIVDSGTVTTVSTVTTLSQFGGAAINLGVGTVGTGTLRMVIAQDDPVNDYAVLMAANLVAHDAADAGSPLKVGAKASNALSGLTLVANADRTDLFAGLDGVLITRPHSNLEDAVKATVGVTDGSSTSLVASQGAGLKFCATTLVVSNSSATNVTVDIRDGTAGAVIMTIPAAANMGGAVIPMQTPLCTSDATALAMDPSAAATTVTVTALGFKTNL